MKFLPNIAGLLLGLAFMSSSALYFLNLVPMPLPPTGSPPDLWMRAMIPTGYMDFVKLLELFGGVLVAFPWTRNYGLLVLAPIIVNIIAFHYFIAAGEGLFSPPTVVVSVLAGYLLWCGRMAFVRLSPRFVTNPPVP